MKVSCIMSNYNTSPEFLRPAIESVLKQTMDDFEFIIVDDGSNDSSTDVLEEYRRKDKRIKVLYNDTNHGLAFSLNRAIKESSGEYLARMDTDDYSLPDRFEKQILYLESHKNIDIIGSYAKCFGALSGYGYTPYIDQECCRSALLCYDCLIHPTVMMRRSFLQSNNLEYDPSFQCSQDFDLWTRSLDYGQISILPEVLFLYRYHSAQLTTSKREIQKECSRRICLNSLKRFSSISDNEELCHLMLNGNEKFDINKVKDCIGWIYKLSSILEKPYSKKTTQKILFTRLYILLLRSDYASCLKIKTLGQYKELRSLSIIAYQFKWLVNTKLILPMKYNKYLRLIESSRQ